MSMIGNYLRIPEVQLARLREDPSDILELLHPDDGNGERPHGKHLDIDKAWHAIQFLLTGDPWEGKPPLQNAVMGGIELGDEDVGYGPARGLSAHDVQAVSRALSGISGEQLWSGFDADKFANAEIYPEGWSAEGRGYVVGYYEALRTFFAEAAGAGDSMILYLS